MERKGNVDIDEEKGRRIRTYRFDPLQPEVEADEEDAEDEGEGLEGGLVGERAASPSGGLSVGGIGITAQDLVHESIHTALHRLHRERGNEWDGGFKFRNVMRGRHHVLMAILLFH